MTDVLPLQASIAAGGGALLGPPQTVGPRFGADRGQPIMAARVLRGHEGLGTGAPRTWHLGSIQP